MQQNDLQIRGCGSAKINAWPESLSKKAADKEKSTGSGNPFFPREGQEKWSRDVREGSGVGRCAWLTALRALLLTWLTAGDFFNLAYPSYPPLFCSPRIHPPEPSLTWSEDFWSFKLLSKNHLPLISP